MLTNPKYGYNKIFHPNCIFVFSPTFESDTSYKDLKKKMKGYEQNCVEDLDYELIDLILERQKEAKKQKKARPVLLLFDDLVTKLNPKKLTILTELYFRGRHHFINIIMSSQQFRAIPKAMRLNCDSMIAFPNNMNSIEKKDITMEAPDDFFEGLCDRLETENYNRYDFIYVNLKFDKYNRWFRCFDRKFKILKLNEKNKT